MEATAESSPLKLLCTFLLGLATFAAFGLFGVMAFKASGGDKDPAYEARAEERIAIREGALAAQAEKLSAAPVDIATAVGTLGAKRAAPSTKPLPGTKAFEDWMAAQAAAQPPPPPVEPANTEGAAEVVKLKIEALPGGVMKYKQIELTVKAGSKVELTFVNPDVMQHNFLLLKPGTKEKVGALADAMLLDPEAMKKQYIPVSDDILTATKLVNPASTIVHPFTAPAEPGDYPYICTFPGHWRLMFGTLKVTP